MVSGSWACTSMHEPEVGGQVAADFVPGIAGVVAAHHVPVLLHEEHAGTRAVHGDVVDAVADFGRRVGDVFGLQPAIDGPPGLRRHRRCGTRPRPRWRCRSAGDRRDRE